MFYFMTGKQVVQEAALAMNTSHDALRGHLSKALKTAHGVDPNSWSSDGPYIHDVFPGHVVYQHKGETFKRTHTVTQGAAGTDPEVKLGEPKKVHVAYVDSKESGNVLFNIDGDVVTTQESEDSVQIRESITFDDSVVDVQEAKLPSTILVKLIAEGWGSMAYYSKEVLKRDGPKVFKKGTHMYWNHATATEEAERPEGNLNDLAAVLTEDAVWEDDGVKGAGLYSKAKVFSDYQTQVAEKGAHIGVSINAGIKAHEGEIAGRVGKIADKFVVAYSTDFVTRAGAGGAPIVPVTESGGPQPIVKENNMTDADAKALKDENDTLKSCLSVLETSQNKVVAVATVGSILREANIPYSRNLLERACESPVMKEGKPEENWVKGIVADFTESETGRVTGNGTASDRAKEKEKNEEAEKRFKENMKDLGVPDAGLDYAIRGRV